MYIRDMCIYNLLKIDKPNHRRERNKGQITLRKECVSQIGDRAKGREKS